ncbi:hypothetical protein [Streptomyces sp. MA5143a]|uniref:hypothetical protein n=1 Tax=Streptomyces sp. MA5143a TaxID=2083010 RepID=UPI0011B2647D|nr:hypothetical protein [Streptomyces sp. MA5143a]
MTSGLVGGVVGLIVGLVGAEINRRHKADELFFKALEFVKRGTQNRNVGISAVELYWGRKRRRPLCVGFMVGSAIYLLRESGQGAAAHERFNLDRIMALLSKYAPKGESVPHYCALLEAVKAKRAGRRGGIVVDDDQLEEWEKQLNRLTKRQTSS